MKFRDIRQKRAYGFDYGVANGFDYGDFARLPLDTLRWPLNQIEKTACAYGRPYGSIMKLKPKFEKPRSLEGHIINFVQDAPDMAAAALNRAMPNIAALKQVRVMFYGLRSQFEESRKNGAIATVPLTARPDGILKLLRCLKVTNPRY